MAVISVACAAVLVLAAMVMAFSAVMLPAFVPVVIALNLRVICKGAGNQGFYRIIGAALNAAVKLDLRFFQGIPCAHTNAAADQGIDLMLL